MARRDVNKPHQSKMFIDCELFSLECGTYDLNGKEAIYINILGV